jgi:DNA-binding transcriptional LysR family regulator
MDRITGVQLFARIVETGSFSKAAADLGLTQPTATKHVAAIEAQLGARLLNRNTRGVSATEIGALYYDKCKAIQRTLEEADNLASLLQSKVGGQLRISTSVAFGRRVVTPLALRMGKLADSSLGARYLGSNPWLVAASPAYLEQAGVPDTPQDLARHACLIYSSVQGDERWQFTDAQGQLLTVPVQGPLRSNNLSAVLAAARAGHGVAVLPWYVARESLADGTIQPVLTGFAQPAQELNAVFPSPKLVPSKVATFIAFLGGQLEGEWWSRGFDAR